MFVKWAFWEVSKEKTSHRNNYAPSVIDHEPMRRMILKLENTFIEVSRKAFMSSSNSNQKFIEDHHTVVRCTGEAGAMVFSTVLDYACIGGNMELTATDTDLVVILIHV